MLDKFKDLLAKEKKDFPMPRHIVVTTTGIQAFSKENGITVDEANKKSFDVIKSLIEEQIKLDIPIITFHLIPEYSPDKAEYYMSRINAAVSFFKEIIESPLINNNKVRLSVVGKWYSLPSEFVETVKKVSETTKDYDNYFVNFCINYNGQEEIVDAFKLLGMQIKAGKLDPDAINKKLVKDNIYSSKFLPPDLVIVNGLRKKTNGILLWDSAYSHIHFTQTLFPEFDEKRFNKIIKDYEKENK